MIDIDLLDVLDEIVREAERKYPIRVKRGRRVAFLACVYNLVMLGRIRRESDVVAELLRLQERDGSREVQP